MNNQNHTKINEWLNGHLTSDEIAILEKKLNTDKIFADDFKFWKKMRKYLQQEKNEEVLKSLLAEIQEKDNSNIFHISGRNRKILHWVSSVAALFILIIAALMLLQDNRPLYDQFVEKQPAFEIDLTHKGPGEPYNGESFNNKEYPKAYKQLKEFLKDNPSNPYAQLALGISAMELGKFDEAEQIFANVSKGNSELSINGSGTWYLAMNYLNHNKTEECKNTLMQMPESSSSSYEKLAYELLKKLEN